MDNDYEPNLIKLYHSFNKSKDGSSDHLNLNRNLYKSDGLDNVKNNNNLLENFCNTKSDYSSENMNSFIFINKNS